MLYDITRAVSPLTAVWPGDSPFQVAHMMRKADGASVNLTTLTLSAHTGTHADASYHYDDAGADAALMPLEAYIGPARVLTTTRTNGTLTPDDFGAAALAGVERLLIHSHVSALDDETWPSEFPHLSVELIAHLAAQGCRLVGLDSPSVDAFDSKDLPCHHALKAHGMVNLESLFLRGVPDGDYRLVALPLKLRGACGSPVRAILQAL